MTLTRTDSLTHLRFVVQEVVADMLEEKREPPRPRRPCQSRNERPVLDKNTPLGLTEMRCKEHEGRHRQIAVRRFDREKGQVTVACFCSLSVLLEWHRQAVMNGYSTYKHFQLEEFPSSPQALEEALQ